MKRALIVALCAACWLAGCASHGASTPASSSGQSIGLQGGSSDVEMAKARAAQAAAKGGAPSPDKSAPNAAGSFADNPIVYFVVTDRFYNGNPANDHSYGRTREADPQADLGTFHGGDLAGLTAKLNEGWFKALGINAIWITAPYEQIHGWVVGGNKEFKHYAYHGYYALDYTRLDANMGTEDELRTFVDTAHAQGIRVLFDVVMNHPGYGDIRTLSELMGTPHTDKKDGVLWKGYETATLRDYHSYIDYNDPAWLQWWGPDWIRSGLRGYEEGGRDDLTMQLAYLPDFKTESPKAVDLPPLLKAKHDTRAVALPDTTVRGYLVKWLSAWVETYGIDGFRCDTVKHVEPASWSALKSASTAALARWKAAHPTQTIDDAPFWMTGEFWGQGIGPSPLYDAGFDNLINFKFQDEAQDALAAGTLDRLFDEYAKLLKAPTAYNVLSYLSSHDTRLFDRTKMFDAADALMLAPGGVQVFYGDESGRAPGPFTPGDKQQATRSDMNWSSVDTALLAHWRTLGSFRAHHVALARGAHRKLADQPYTFARVHANDRVVVALGAKGTVAIDVGGVFDDGTRVRDAYGGTVSRVEGGHALVSAAAHGVVLLERAP